MTMWFDFYFESWWLTEQTDLIKVASSICVQSLFSLPAYHIMNLGETPTHQASEETSSITAGLHKSLEILC